MTTTTIPRVLTLDDPEPPCQSIVMLQARDWGVARLVIQREGARWVTTGEVGRVAWQAIVETAAKDADILTLLYEGTCHGPFC